jgi:hypothetical protein
MNWRRNAGGCGKADVLAGSGQVAWPHNPEAVFLRHLRSVLPHHRPAIEQLAISEAATWLDRTIIAETKPVIHEKGFCAEVSKALTGDSR